MKYLLVLLIFCSCGNSEVKRHADIAEEYVNKAIVINNIIATKYNTNDLENIELYQDTFNYYTSTARAHIDSANVLLGRKTYSRGR